MAKKVIFAFHTRRQAIYSFAILNEPTFFFLLLNGKVFVSDEIFNIFESSSLPLQNEFSRRAVDLIKTSTAVEAASRARTLGKGRKKMFFSQKVKALTVLLSFSPVFSFH